MLQIRYLTKEAELRSYQEAAFKVLKIKFPFDYIRRSRVKVFKQNNRIVGGYMTLKEGPFRSFMGIPDFDSSKLYNEKELIEVNGAWFNPKIKNRFKTYTFWKNLAQDIASYQGKKYFVFTYDGKNDKLHKTYQQRMRPTIIFKGETLQLEGMASAAIETIVVASIRRMSYLPIHEFFNIIIRNE